MKRNTTLKIILIFVVVFLCLSCSEKSDNNTFKFYGQVIDSITNQGLDNVLIALHSKDSTLKLFTDRNGNFLLNDLDKKFYLASYLKYGYFIKREERTRVGYPKYGSLEIKMIPNTSPELNDCVNLNSYEEGFALAENEIVNNNASVYGGGWLKGYPRLDVITGLPIKLIYGCIGSRELDCIIKGHNDKVYKYISESGIPSYRRLWKYYSSEFVLRFLREDDNFQNGIELNENNVDFIDTDSVYNITTSLNSNYHTLFIETQDTLVPIIIPQPRGDFLTFWWGPKDEQVIFLKHANVEDIYYMIDLINFDLYLVSRSSSHILN